MSRIAVCALLFAASCLLVGHRADPATAQDKKDKDKKDTATEKQVADLQKQLKAAQQDIQQAVQQINALKTVNNNLQAANNRLEAALKKEKGNDAKDDKKIDELQAIVNNYKSAGLIHVVILKLKADSPSAEPQSLIDDTYSQLSKIKTVRGVWAGKPSSKGTPDAATEYTVALVFVFDNADGLKTYLNDAIHTKFADKHLKKWETPIVYDFEPKKAAP